MSEPARLISPQGASNGTRAASLSPPAVWTAFAHQAQWKNWVLLGQLVVIVLLVLVCLSIAKTDPDVVVVDGDGKSTYVRKGVAGPALVRFLEQQKGQPSDLTVLSYTARLLKVCFAPNSSMLEEQHAECLGMMDAKLRAATEEEYKREKVNETYKLLKARTELTVDALDVVEQADLLIHLRAKVSRTRSSLLDASKPSSDSLTIDIVERVVPRRLDRPDGLEAAELIVTLSREPSPADGPPPVSPPTTSPGMEAAHGAP